MALHIKNKLFVFAFLVLTQCSNDPKKQDPPASTREVWFESNFGDPNKRNQQYEVVRISFQDNQLEGRGAGSAEGEPDWTFSFDGSLNHDTIAQINSTYQKDDGKKISVSETWIIDSERKHLTRKKSVPDIYCCEDFHATERNYIPKFYVDRLK